VKIGSLFSGIGGLELGLERAGLGRVVWQVEQNPFCRAVLAKHWPDADRSVCDVREASATNLAPIDVLAGGFPCQDIADTEGSGLAGARSGLWFEMLRLVRELRPRGVVIENVDGLSTKGLDVVLAGLASCGLDAIWFPVRAFELGAPHRRARIFVVAYANRDGREPFEAARLHLQGTRRDDVDGRGDRVPGPDDGADTWRAYASTGGPQPGILRGVDGFPTRLDRARLAAHGNAVHPAMGEVAGHVLWALLTSPRAGCAAPPRTP
jgi:DNA (cytosine-5)-methyltransferase 1